MAVDYTLDHGAIEDAHATRRYFNKFEKIIGHLSEVAEMTTDDKEVLEREIPILQNYLDALANTFKALSYKYLFAGRMSSLLPELLDIDRQESGFPIYQELLQMASDAIQKEKHLKNLPDMQKLKQDMVRHILNEHSTPSEFQYAASQRLYYGQLTDKNLFWAQNDPQASWQGNIGPSRRKYLVHWALYDSQLNIPVIYLMDLEDSGSSAIVKDERRWPRVQAQLMAQSSASLKLVTIARGFDEDFDDLHPKRLRRFFVGPMYSHAFTEQTGPLRDVLADASGQEGLDWSLAWTIETLISERTETKSTGFFSSAERQIYQLDPLASIGKADEGATHQQRSLILPQRAYQVLEERNPPGFANVRKYVVGNRGRILSHK